MWVLDLQSEVDLGLAPGVKSSEVQLGLFAQREEIEIEQICRDCIEAQVELNELF